MVKKRPTRHDILTTSYLEEHGGDQTYGDHRRPYDGPDHTIPSNQRPKGAARGEWREVELPETPLKRKEAELEPPRPHDRSLSKILFPVRPDHRNDERAPTPAEVRAEQNLRETLNRQQREAAKTQQRAERQARREQRQELRAQRKKWSDLAQLKRDGGGWGRGGDEA